MSSLQTNHVLFHSQGHVHDRGMLHVNDCSKICEEVCREEERNIPRNHLYSKNSWFATQTNRNIGYLGGFLRSAYSSNNTPRFLRPLNFQPKTLLQQSSMTSQSFNTNQTMLRSCIYQSSTISSICPKEDIWKKRLTRWRRLHILLSIQVLVNKGEILARFTSHMLRRLHKETCSHGVIHWGRSTARCNGSCRRGRLRSLWTISWPMSNLLALVTAGTALKFRQGQTWATSMLPGFVIASCTSRSLQSSAMCQIATLTTATTKWRFACSTKCSPTFAFAIFAFLAFAFALKVQTISGLIEDRLKTICKALKSVNFLHDDRQLVIEDELGFTIVTQTHEIFNDVIVLLLSIIVRNVVGT